MENIKSQEIQTIKLVNVEFSELEKMVYSVAKRAALDALEEQNDELLNITQLCERIGGLTLHTFNRLKEKKRLKCVGGKYSLKEVRKAMQA